MGSAAMSVALMAATPGATTTPDAQPGLATGPGWRATQEVPGPVPRGPIADTTWLSLGSVPGKGTRWQEMSRTALLDLHQLSRQNGAVAAGQAVAGTTPGRVTPPSLPWRWRAQVTRARHCRR